MKFRKNIIALITLIILSLSFATNVAAQDSLPKPSSYNYKQGYHFIKKAEDLFEAGNYKKAKRLLAKAKTADYGFCGNAWASAYGAIDEMSAKICIRQKKYDEALAILDLGGCGFGADCEARDSLKVVALIGKFGKEKTQKAFSSASVQKTDNVLYEEYSVDLPALSYTFHFINSYWVTSKDEEDFKILMTMQKFYNQLN